VDVQRARVSPLSESLDRAKKITHILWNYGSNEFTIANFRNDFSESGASEVYAPMNCVRYPRRLATTLYVLSKDVELGMIPIAMQFLDLFIRNRRITCSIQQLCDSFILSDVSTLSSGIGLYDNSVCSSASVADCFPSVSKCS
jgi:hypothetical protein